MHTKRIVCWVARQCAEPYKPKRRASQPDPRQRSKVVRESTSGVRELNKQVNSKDKWGYCMVFRGSNAH